MILIAYLIKCTVSPNLHKRNLTYKKLITYYHTGVLPMSYSIIPNRLLGFGFFLVLVDRAGQSEKIPCHNRATAQALARSLKAKHAS